MRDLNGKRAAVVGMAKSGVAAVELLRRHGAEVRAIDQRSAAELAEESAPRFQRGDGIAHGFLPPSVAGRQLCVA